jgi:hypothetical protein
VTPRTCGEQAGTGQFDDDGMLIWLSNRSDAAETFATNFLLQPDA